MRLRLFAPLLIAALAGAACTGPGGPSAPRAPAEPAPAAQSGVSVSGYARAGIRF
ncbi:hypothetical protein [Marinibacterium sp. SX1]|uniref:hypothetical protein n=1 Tax=Marinibacterium sp. SX1 TaxID=3388424 RepID=UPI003D1834B4